MLNQSLREKCSSLRRGFRLHQVITATQLHNQGREASHLYPRDQSCFHLICTFCKYFLCTCSIWLSMSWILSKIQEYWHRRATLTQTGAQEAPAPTLHPLSLGTSIDAVEGPKRESREPSLTIFLPAAPFVFGFAAPFARMALVTLTSAQTLSLSWRKRLYLNKFVSTWI